ncbi:MAG: sigma-54-dependent Fis family transcriptional regulator [Alphaproteobacteria bacterium]|nr:sigma-54-dependent Fis family transcriptional regulator [Alphaproteobacteria bacterium]
MAERILVVDDELSMREFLQILLERAGYTVAVAASGEAALEAAREELPGLVLTDLNMPGMSGLDLLRELKALAAGRSRDVEVVVVTAFGSTESAVEAMRMGAADYVMKPFNNAELLLVVERALERLALEAENERLRTAVGERFHFGHLVGSSRMMGEVYDLIRRVKDTRINCLIEGESGTGKEMVARAIHFSGRRKARPFVPINCGAIPESLVESELFGHVKGSFTGAHRDKQGLMRAADGGTLFLDEVASLPPSAQVTLLRALQERRFTPVGAVREIEVDVRIIAASNVPLQDAVAEGTFREDLYYRLNVVRIALPPLRERGDDVLELARQFLERYRDEYGKPIDGIAPDTARALRAYHYPGNVRELQNIMERAVALCEGQRLSSVDLPSQVTGAETSLLPGAVDTEPGARRFPDEGVNLESVLAAEERKWLVRALEAADGNKTQAARLLQMTFRAFRYRLAKYGMDEG